jgi:hypothetical protein
VVLTSKRAALVSSHAGKLRQLPTRFGYDTAVREGPLDRDIYFSLVRNGVFEEVSETEEGSKVYTLANDVEDMLKTSP